MTPNCRRRRLLAGALALPFLPRPAVAGPPALVFSQAIELSGPMARGGDQWRNGVEMAVQEINAAGGVQGQRLQVSTFDSANGRAAVQRALDGGTFALLGPVSPEGVRMAAPLARNARLAAIVGADSVDLASFGCGTFRAAPGLAVRMPRLAGWLRDGLAARRVSVVWTNSESGRLARDLLGLGLRARGIEIASDQSTLPGASTYATEIATIARTSADAAFVGLPEADCARFLAEARHQALKVKLVGDTTLAAPRVVAQAAGAAEGVLCHTSFTAAAPGLAAFRDRFLDGFKDEPDAAVVKGYTAVGMLAAGIARMGRVDRYGLADALRGLSVPAGGPAMLMAATWDATGEMDRETFLIEVRDGKPVLARTFTGRA
jgi:branched-chain amino acid transport system substrate-binding protein